MGLANDSYPPPTNAYLVNWLMPEQHFNSENKGQQMTTSRNARKRARERAIADGSHSVPKQVKRRQRGACIDWLHQNGYLKNKARTTSNSLIASLLKDHFPYGSMRDSILLESKNYRVISRTYGIIEKDDLLVNLSRRPSPEDGTKNVYFVGDKDKKVVKIGVAKDVVRRCASIQGGFPTHLYVFRVIRNAGYELEKVLHRKYRKMRSQGEWFFVRDELAEFLKDCQPVPYRTYSDES